MFEVLICEVLVVCDEMYYNILGILLEDDDSKKDLNLNTFDQHKHKSFSCEGEKTDLICKVPPFSLPACGVFHNNFCNGCFRVIICFW